MKLGMSNNWFWVIFWCLVIGGCVADKAITLNYNIEQQKLKTEELRQRLEQEQLRMKELSDTIVKLKQGDYN